MFNGKVTKDGYHPLTPADTSIFNVAKAPPRTTTTITWSKFLGLADLGTGNYTEWP